MKTSGWADVATKSDLHRLAERVDARFELLDARFDAVDARFETTKQELIAIFRGELISQTRTIIFALVGTVISLGALALGVSGTF
ncbi:MAG: hypothetical protein KY429_07550 [Actinobacteria bacterium]|nr:hypothetical protein [Actinomycetota bacterium]